MFSIYLNDLTRSSEVLNFVNFVDDTTVFLSHPSSDALYVSFNDELGKVSEWLKANRLSFNVVKPSYVLIGNKKGGE